MAIVDILHALADWSADSSQAPGTPVGPGPGSGVPPLGAPATDSPAYDDESDGSAAGDQSDDSPPDPYKKNPSLKDLARTGRRALEDLLDIGKEVVDLKTKPYDQLTEDEKIATGRKDPASEDLGEEILKKGIDEAMEHAPPGASEALDYALETVENSSQAVTEGVLTIHNDKVRRRKLLDDILGSGGQHPDNGGDDE